MAARWLAALPPRRRARLARLRSAADLGASLAGLALLLAAARAAGLAPPDPAQLVFPDRGKPRWPGGPDFSVSHGGGRVGCALIVPAGRVGLDLERSDAATWHDLRLVLAPGERAGGGAAGATAVWVGTEAVLKAAGATLADAAAVTLADATAVFGGHRWRLARPMLATGVLCAIASDVEAAIEPVEDDAAALLAAGP